MFRSTKSPESRGSRLLTSFSSAKVIVPPYVGFAAALAVAGAPLLVAPGPVVVGAQAPTRTAAVANRANIDRRNRAIFSPSRPVGLVEHTSGYAPEFSVPRNGKGPATGVLPTAG